MTGEQRRRRHAEWEQRMAGFAERQAQREQAREPHRAYLRQYQQALKGRAPFPRTTKAGGERDDV